MAQGVSSTPREVPDWLRSQTGPIVGSSWLCSAIFHVTAALAIWYIAQLPGCRAVRGEQIGDGPGREVGIFTREPGEAGGASPGNPLASPGEVVASTEIAASSTASSEGPVTIEMPVDLSLPPKSASQVLGTGAPPQSAVSAASGAGGPGATFGQRDGRGTGKGGSGAGSGNGGGGSGTSMFGVQAKGKKFVYVIDRSSSMDVTLAAAKGELLASIQRLDSNQEFQVVFFNQAPQALQPKKEKMFRGTETDRLAVMRQLDAIDADGGTARLEALEKAYSFKPDVVYFLTDVNVPMSPDELERAVALNRSRAQVHCIEFGEGPEVKEPPGKVPTNFLRKLARLTGGVYVYREIAGLSGSQQ